MKVGYLVVPNSAAAAVLKARLISQGAEDVIVDNDAHKHLNECLDSLMLGDSLCRLRQQSGMTQKAFAEYFDIPQRTLENWEGGQRGCPKYLLKLMQYKLKNEGIIE